MTLEAVLASLHLVAILTLVVFMSSQAALCRIEWLNAAVVERLVRLDVIYNVTALVLLLTGLARVVWGIKGMSWYVSQPLFHVKVTLFVVMVLLSIWPTLSFRRWRSQLRATGALPQAREVGQVRRLVMVQSHILPVVAVIALFCARGWSAGPVVGSAFCPIAPRNGPARRADGTCGQAFVASMPSAAQPPGTCPVKSPDALCQTRSAGRARGRAGNPHPRRGRQGRI